VDLQTHFNRLRADIDVFASLLEVPEQQARWKPGPERWSLLEVINHLADEEAEDFRLRVELGLFKPEERWPAFDSWEWVTSRRYNDRDLSESMDRFVAERQSSLTFLEGIREARWDHIPPQPGNLRVGDVMVSWVAHDFFHIRQISMLLWEYLADSASYSTEYAGEF